MVIQRLETFTKVQTLDPDHLRRRPDHQAPVSVVRVTTDTGEQGIGQISPYNADISATVFHRQVAPHALEADPNDIEGLINHIIEEEYKFPGSYVCRALTGLDTALWDLRAKGEEMSVCELLGGKPGALKPYGSSMRRDIEPADEAARLAALEEECGYEAFKIRVGSKMGHDEDQWSGRTEELVPAVREAVGDDTALYVDANSCYTPGKAVEVGEMLDDYGVVHFEEPCPFWELEWTAEVRKKLSNRDIHVAGGEQDNSMAQWRRIIDLPAVDIVQPDICYIGGLTRTLRVAEWADEVGLVVTPHSANHSMVTVFTMHMISAIDNPGPYFEFSIEDQWAEGMLEPALTVENGEIEIPDSPGWGVEITPEWLATSTYEVSEAS